MARKTTLKRRNKPSVWRETAIESRASGRIARLEPLEARALLAVTATLVADINTLGTPASTPTNLTVVGANAFFVADDGVHGRELWKTDGTLSGTALVADLTTGSGGSFLNYLTAVNGQLFFTKGSGTSWELWKSDGSESGTTKVRNLGQLRQQSGGVLPAFFCFNNELYFSSNANGTSGFELWKSDGTSSGTALVADINPGAGDSWISNFSVSNGRLFFTAVSNVVGSTYDTALWTSDGTSSGTTMISPVFQTQNTGGFKNAPHSLTNVNDTLYFTVFTTSGADQLWKSDGTSGGTALFTTLQTLSSTSSGARALTNVNGTLFFADWSPTTSAWKLWTSDGSVPGTLQLAVPGDVYSSAALTQFGGSVVYYGRDGALNYGLQISDGTVAGTSRLSDSIDTPHATPSGSRVFFLSNTPSPQLWATDGTSSGTSLVKDLLSGQSSKLDNLIDLNGKLLFTAEDGVHGIELWTSDGTSSGTAMVRDINALDVGSKPGQFRYLNGLTYFVADDGVHGGELWKTNGTSSGTSMVVDFNPGPANAFPASSSDDDSVRQNALGVGLNQLFMAASDGVHGSEVVKSDGAAAGTVLVEDRFSGGLYPSGWTELNGKVLFSGDSLLLGSTDGSTISTVRSSPGKDLTRSGNYVYFVAKPLTTRELWRTDGTTVGTAKVTNLDVPYELLDFNGTLFFTSVGGLRKTDGTPAGTTNFGSGYTNTLFLTNANGALYFVSNNKLYKSDGTPAGTVQLGNASAGSHPAFDGSHLYFTYSNELWQTDGTSSGTSLVRTFSLTPNNLTASGGRVYFSASDGVHGREMWTSDGTSAGTYMVSDINPGAGNSYPQDLADINGTLYFSADNGSIGRELWRINSPPSAQIIGSLGALRDQSQTFTLNASDVLPADQAAGFTFAIDWGDGSPIQTVSGPSGTTVAHTFSSVGSRTVAVTATDQNGGTGAAATLNVNVTAVQLLPNAQNSSLTDLVWLGTGGADQVKFEQIGPTSVRVRTLAENGVSTNVIESFAGVTGRVIASGGSGDDTLDASALTATQATLDGQAGNNKLYGGQAGDILIGGSNGAEGRQGNNTIVAGNGNNTIYGNAVVGFAGSTGGNNLIVGGNGNDTIYGTYATVQKLNGSPSNGAEGGQNLIVGSGGSDTIYASQQADGAEGGKGSILIAGTTSLDELALASVLSEWTSTRAYSTKIANIQGTGSGPRNNGNDFLQGGATVFDDASVDQLFSDTKGQLNWLLYAFYQDVANRAKPGETLTDTP